MAGPLDMRPDGLWMLRLGQWTNKTRGRARLVPLGGPLLQDPGFPATGFRPRLFVRDGSRAETRLGSFPPVAYRDEGEENADESKRERSARQCPEDATPTWGSVSVRMGTLRMWQSDLPKGSSNFKDRCTRVGSVWCTVVEGARVPSQSRAVRVEGLGKWGRRGHMRYGAMISDYLMPVLSFTLTRKARHLHTWPGSLLDYLISHYTRYIASCCFGCCCTHTM